MARLCNILTGRREISLADLRQCGAIIISEWSTLQSCHFNVTPKGLVEPGSQGLSDAKKGFTPIGYRSDAQLLFPQCSRALTAAGANGYGMHTNLHSPK